MANLCAKLPIYEVTEGEVDPNAMNGGTGVGRIPAKRKYHSQSEFCRCIIIIQRQILQ